MIAETIFTTNMDHPNIIKSSPLKKDIFYIGKKPTKKNSKEVYFIELEYAQEGELFDYIKHSTYLEIPIAKFYFKQ